jgi:hypothetical protein
MGQKFKQVALEYLSAGISVVPANLKFKKPALEEWTPFQKVRATEQEADVLFRNGNGIGVITGNISGNMEILDFDYIEDQKIIRFPEWRKIVETEAPGLFEKLLLEKTPGEGFHVGYRCPEMQIPGNTKLARRKIGVKEDGKDKVKATIETRGEGGFCIVAPSHMYQLMQGKWIEPPIISMQERNVLINAARSLNEYVEPHKVLNGPRRSPNNKELSLGDDYNERGDFRGLLTKHGWQYVKTQGIYERWRRPGKDQGWSASLIEGKTFYVFSANASPFDVDISYSPFAVYAYLEHGGDFSAAARKLSQEGYGKQPEDKKNKITGMLLNLDELDKCFDLVTDWLYRNHIPKGHPVMFAGREGDGKTSNLIQIGKEILEQRPDGVVVWVATEGRVQDTRNKLHLLGVDRKRFLMLSKPGYKGRPSFLFDFRQPSERQILDEQLRAVTEATGQPVLMVIIDSIRGMSQLEDNDSKVGNIMIRLNEIVCDTHRAALVYIDHFNKQINLGRLVDKVTGSTAKVAAVTVTYAVLPQTEYTVKITVAKNNILDHEPTDLLSVLSGHQITLSEMQEDMEGKTKQKEVERWMIGIFNQKKEWYSADIYEEGKKEGYSESLIKKVRKDLPIRMEKEDFSGRWVSIWMG